MSVISRARIGVLTAGGDAPGLNAVIRAVGRRALDEGDEAVGILNGWSGLLTPGGHRGLGPRDLAGLLPRGGTTLGSSKTPPWTTQRRSGGCSTRSTDSDSMRSSPSAATAR
jgi:ATP-dependent phosphofructokinase / diphosphate-dependent phosphofructokinase